VWPESNGGMDVALLKAKWVALMPDTTKQELLRKAVDLAGLDDVARALAASPELVEAWMTGRALMPDGKLLVLAAFLDRLGRPEKG
jgi:hypothetical protein